jgi:hypothetical protein
MQSLSRLSIPFAVALIALAVPQLLGCGVSATRPLRLEPRIRPSDFAPSQRFSALDLISFENTVPEPEAKSRFDPELRFHEPPEQVFSDTLLTALRNSEAFERVARDRAAGSGRYVLRGRLARLEVEQLGFGWRSSFEADIRAACETHFTLEDTETGQLILDETATTEGSGSSDLSRGRSGTITSIDPRTGRAVLGTIQETSVVDPTEGYETSLSQSISRNVAIITERVLGALTERAESGATSSR